MKIHINKRGFNGKKDKKNPRVFRKVSGRRVTHINPQMRFEVLREFGKYLKESRRGTMGGVGPNSKGPILECENINPMLICIFKNLENVFGHQGYSSFSQVANIKSPISFG